MSSWAIAIAIGLSLTRPSDLTTDVPAAGDRTTFSHVRWSGQPFVSPLYYVVRIEKGDVALDFTHYKIVAATHETVPERGTWHGDPVDDSVRLDQRVQHFEVSHGVNALAIVGIAHSAYRRGLYAGAGPVIYLSHAESTVDGKAAQWGYGHSGNGFEVFAGDGLPAPFAELKYDVGSIAVGIAGGTASLPLNTLHVSIAP